MSNETSHIFICYSSKDEAAAREISQFLEDEDLKCWISLARRAAGPELSGDHRHALENARDASYSYFRRIRPIPGEIKKELSLAGSFDAPVFPVRLSPVTPTGALRYELATRQWIDMFPEREEPLPQAGRDDPRHARIPRRRRADEVGTDAVATVAPGIVAHPATRRRHRRISARGAAQAPIVAVGSEEFESVRALLAHHVGPIAKILIEKTAAKARTRDDLCERLAAHVKAPSDRAAFVQAARAQLAIESVKRRQADAMSGSQVVPPDGISAVCSPGPPSNPLQNREPRRRRIAAGR